jgi:hypothetical protein
MQRIEYRNPTVNKLTAFGPGPWVDEVDKVQWQDDATGLPCLVKRNHMGAWCGYVGVSKGHPLFEDTEADYKVEPHGGGAPSRASASPTTTARSGTPSGTGEYGSKLPRLNEDVTYRDLAYVTGETVRLARDLHELDTLSLQSPSA